MEYENIKSTIGRLIAFERKRLYNLTQSDKYTQINLVARKGERYLANCKMCQTPCSSGKDKNKNICSRSTVIKMETGLAVLSDCYYVGIIENLGFKYWLDELIIKEMNQLEALVLEFLSTASQELLDKLNDAIPKYKNKYKDVFYFSDLLLLYEEVVSLVAEDTSTNALSDDKIKFYYEYGSEVVKDIVCIAVIRKYLSFKCYADMIDDVFDKIADKWDIPYMFSYCLLKLKENGQVVMFDNLMKIYYDRYSELNSFNKYNLLSVISYIYLNDESVDMAMTYLKKCENIVEYSDYNLIDILRIRTLKNMGICNYFIKNYEEAVNNFLKIEKIDINKLNFNLILLIDMLDSLGRVEEIKVILNDKNYSRIEIQTMKKIFKYYLNKYSKPLTKEHAMNLEKSIIEDLNFFDKGSESFKIFERELKKLINITKDYKMLYLYNK